MKTNGGSERRAFACAARGFLTALRTQRHMRIHLCFTFYVVLAGFVTEIGAVGWAAVLICCALVLGAECVNTALEALCDEVSPEFSPRVRLAKDAAAGAVLVCAVIAAIVGALVFFTGGRPKQALDFAADNWLAATLIVLTLPAWLIYIFRNGSKKQ